MAASPHCTAPTRCIYRADRFVKSVRVLTFKDVNVEELTRRDFRLPDELSLDS